MSFEFRQRLETYLDDDRYAEPKCIFRTLARLMEEAGATSGRFLDVGCATGELIYFLKQRFTGLEFTGVDKQPEFLERARSQPRLRDVSFVQGDALAFRDAEPFDVVSCFGVISIFEAFEPLLANLLANTRKGGRIFVHGLFNDVDIDVRLMYRDHHNRKDWNGGFNIFSLIQVGNWLESHAASWRAVPVELDVDIAPRQDFPHRAYTVKLESGRRATANGLCLMLPEKILEIVA